MQSHPRKATRRGLKTFIALVAGLAASSWAGAMVVTATGFAASLARDMSASPVNGSTSTTSFHSTGGTNSAQIGQSFAVDTYTVTADANSWAIRNRLNHLHGGLAGDLADSTLDLVLTLDVDATYSLYGQYSVLDQGPGATHAWVQASLSDLTTNETLFSSYRSSNALNPSLTLGGDISDQGGAAGALVAGHQYEWFFEASIDQGQGDSAHGSGDLGLSVVAAAGTVAEPGSLALAGLSLAGLALTRRRRA